MSKLRTDQLETLDGLHTKNVSDLIVDLNEAQVTTSTGEQTLTEALDQRVIYVDSIADLLALNTAALKDGQKFEVASFHAGRSQGGHRVRFDPSAPKSGHGTVGWSPTVPPVGLQVGETLQERTEKFVSGDGESDPSGTGLFLIDEPAPYDVAIFGASGDIEDNRALIQHAIEVSPESIVRDAFTCSAILPDGTKSYGGIEIPSNSVVRFSDSGELIALPTDSPEYAILRIENKQNIKLFSPKLTGDRDEHTGTTGEFGMGIFIRSSEGVDIDRPRIKDCWGDGIYIGRKPGDITSKNIRINQPVCDNNRRQGISVVSVSGLTILSPILKNTNGTLPEAGIDFEPNGPDDSLDGIYVHNLITENNAGGGLIFQLKGLNDPAKKSQVSVIIDGFTDIGASASLTGISFSNCRVPHGGAIRVVNPYVENNLYNGIYVRNWHKDGVRIELESPLVVNPNRIGTVYNTDGAGISVYRVSSDSVAEGTGNVHVTNPRVLFTGGATSPVTAKYHLQDSVGGVHNTRFLDIPEFSGSDFSPESYSYADKSTCEIRPLAVSIIKEPENNNGFPSGGVVSSGSNSNGRWIKYADGTMIQTVSGLMSNIATPAGNVFLSSTGSLPWNFPKPFVGAPHYVTSGIGSGGASDPGDAWGGRARLITSTGCYLVVFSSTSVSSTVEITGYAIGRWY